MNYNGLNQYFISCRAEPVVSNSSLPASKGYVEACTLRRGGAQGDTQGDNLFYSIIRQNSPVGAVGQALVGTLGGIAVRLATGIDQRPETAQLTR